MLFMKLSRTEKQVVGDLGEDVASKFLTGRGFKIIGRNYRKKFGEIDVIAEKAGKVHFVEVKTVSRHNLRNPIHNEMDSPVAPKDSYRPEDNVHSWKQKRLSRAIQVYIAENKLQETDWQFDVVTVFLDVENKLAKVKVLEDLIL